jgi:predicted dehydrogenase
MRVAVLGLGFMGSTHLKALRSVPGAELAAIYSGDERKLAGDLSGVHGNLGGPGERLDFEGVARYRDLDQLLADPRIDAVDVCLPTDLHAPVAIAALGARKHVLVEKPMALDGESAGAMIAEAAKANRILMAAQVLRFFPMYAVLKDALGSLGAVRWAAFRRRCATPGWSAWLADPARSGGGVFDLLIHDADMALHLFGAPEAVSATGYEAPADGIDLIAATLHYAGGLCVSISGGWHHPGAYPFSMEYSVIGDDGVVEYSSAVAGGPMLYRASGDAEPLPQLEKDGYAAEIEYFIECCRTGRQPVLCPPEESARAVALTRLLLEARARNGERIACKL